MRLKEKKTIGYAVFSILVIVLLSMYLGKADYKKINETNKQGLVDAKDNSIKIARKLRAYIYEVVDHTPNPQNVVASEKNEPDSQIVLAKKFTFGEVKPKDMNKTISISKKTSNPKDIINREKDAKQVGNHESLDEKRKTIKEQGINL